MVLVILPMIGNLLGGLARFFFKDAALGIAPDQFAGHIQQFEDVLIGNPVVDAHPLTFGDQNSPVDKYLHVAREVGLFHIQVRCDFTAAGIPAFDRLEDTDAVGVCQGIKQPGAKFGRDNGHGQNGINRDYADCLQSTPGGQPAIPQLPAIFLATGNANSIYEYMRKYSIIDGMRFRNFFMPFAAAPVS